MALPTLEYCVRKFSRLKMATVAGEKAPHKPVLLLSIIQSIENNEVSENRVCITPDLVARFKDNWYHLVKNEKFTANFSLPFYHLQSDGFWHLKTLPGKEIALTSSRSIKSFSHLKEVVDYGYFDEMLFGFLLSESSREVLKRTLLIAYFPGSHFSSEETPSIVSDIQAEILRQPPVVYRAKAALFDDEEVFVRSGVFKKVVPKVYNYSCCISGMRITASREVQMIDACHIVPFSESHDDTITNGISLCPNLHRAFDRGLISIDDEYRVLVADNFIESSTDYSIKQFEGKQMALPTDKKYFPSIDNLKWHRRAKKFEV